MALTHALATNNYGPAKLIVATSAANGTHTTLASALADASVGDTVFLRNSVTENVTIPAGVNIACWNGGTLNTPSITGTITMTAAGTSNISGIELITNSAAIIAVTGSAASILNLENCYLNLTNNSGITFSSSNAAALIYLKNCRGDLGTTGINLITSTSAGQFKAYNTIFTNSGSSVTVSTTSSSVLVFRNCDMPIALGATSSGGIDAKFCNFDTTAYNVASVAVTGTGISSFADCDLGGGTATAVTVGSGATVRLWNVGINSSNAAAISGAGTLIEGDITFLGTSSAITATTRTYFKMQLGFYNASGQPAFLAYLASADNNRTGAGTTYTLGTNTALTEVYDQNSDFNTNGTFTAPVTGRYHMDGCGYMTGCTIAAQFQGNFNSSNRLYARLWTRAASSFNGCCSHNSYVDMDAADTCTFQVQVSGEAGDTVDFLSDATNAYTTFSGKLCA